MDLQDSEVVADPPSPRRGRARGLLVIVAGSLGVQAMALATGIITARLLGVEGRGQVALVVAVAALVARVTLGGSLPVAIAQLLARDGLVARDGLRGLWRRWLVLAAGISTTASAYLLWALREEPTDVRVGLAVGVGIVTYQGIVAGILSGALQGELASAARLVVGGLSLQAPFFVAIVAVAAAGRGLDAVDVVALQVVSGLLGLALCWRLLRPPRHGGAPLGRAEVRRVSRANYGNAIGATDSIGLDRNLVGALLGVAQLGLYSAATAVATLSTIVGTAVSTVLMPRLAAAHDDRAAQRRLLRQWLPVTALLIVLVVAGLQAVVGPLIELAFGEEFVAATTTARWLVVADGLFGFRRVLTAVLRARGRGAVASWLEVVMTVLLVGGLVLAAAREDLVLVGMTMCLVGAVSCACLAVAVVLGPGDGRRRKV